MLIYSTLRGWEWRVVEVELLILVVVNVLKVEKLVEKQYEVPFSHVLFLDIAWHSRADIIWSS